MVKGEINMEDLTFKELTDLFLKIRTTSKGKNIRENTKIVHMVNLNKLKSYLKMNNMTYKMLKPYHLSLFIESEKERGYLGKNKERKDYSDSTIYLLTMTLKAFFDFLWENDFMTKNIAKKLKVVRPDNESDIYLYDYEVKLFLTYLKDHEKWNNIRYFEFTKARDLFLFTLIMKHGYRVRETLTLTEDNLNLNKNVIRVFGNNRKNGEDLINRFDNELMELYNNYMKLRPQCNPQDSYLFLSARGGVEISTKDANKILQKRIHEANTYFEMHKDKYPDLEIKPIRDNTEGITIHKLRHTASYLMTSNGYTLPEVAKVLGQKSLAITYRYTHVNLNDLDKKSFKLIG
jgi:site-specific recombinase XerD